MDTKFDVETNPKKIGIVGGMGSGAAAIFFKKLIDYAPATTDQQFPEIILHNNSLIPDRTRAILYNQESPLDQIQRSIQLLNDSQVDIITLCCITAYYYYPQIIAATTATVINPIELTVDHIVNQYPNVSKVGLLATTGTIRSGLFQSAFEKRGLKLLWLDKDDQEKYFMHPIYMENGLKASVISKKAKDLFMCTIPGLKKKNAELIVGGCSEVSLVLHQDMLDIPLVDPIDLMAKETIGQSYQLTTAAF